MDILTLATSVVPDRSTGFTVTVIVAGLGIVLATLAVLILVFKVFGNIVSKSQNKAKEKAKKEQLEQMQNAAANPAPVSKKPASQLEQSGISGEVIAAISAAIYATEGEGAVIRCVTPIKKQSPVSVRNPWANAAIIENTRPF